MTWLNLRKNRKISNNGKLVPILWIFSPPIWRLRRTLPSESVTNIISCQNVMQHNSCWRHEMWCSWGTDSWGDKLVTWDVTGLVRPDSWDQWNRWQKCLIAFSIAENLTLQCYLSWSDHRVTVSPGVPLNPPSLFDERFRTSILFIVISHLSVNDLFDLFEFNNLLFCQVIEITWHWPFKMTRIWNWSSFDI